MNTLTHWQEFLQVCGYIFLGCIISCAALLIFGLRHAMRDENGIMRDDDNRFLKSE